MTLVSPPSPEERPTLVCQRLNQSLWSCSSYSIAHRRLAPHVTASVLRQVPSEPMPPSYPSGLARPPEANDSLPVVADRLPKSSERL